VFCVGHAVQDFVFSVATLPDRGEKYRASRFDSVGGGPAATAAAAIVRLGGNAVLAARVGEDAVAGLIVDELERFGVDCTYVRRCAGCASSVSAVVLDDHGERLIVNHLDPALPADSHWLPSSAAVGASAVLADTRWPSGAQAALQAARADGIPAVLDADVPVPADGELLRAATHVAFSKEALREFSGEADPRRALADVARAFTAWCAVTVGRDGVYAIERGEVRHFRAPDVPVVDTLGAGDVWHGGFALALAEGRTAADAIHFASAAAALKVRRSGGRSSVPTRGELDAYLATLNAA
jgi:sulfofructose kinase